MRKLVLMLSLALVSIAASAQVKFGVRAGINLSSLTLEDTDGLTGTQVGVIVDFPLSEKLSLRPGLYYSMKGATAKVSLYEDFLGATADVDFKLNYIEVPILLSYRFDLSEKVKCRINAGPYFAFGVGGDVEITAFGVSASEDVFSDDCLKSFDWGVAAGVDFEFRKFVVGASYQCGLANINQQDDETINNRVFSISVGYNF